MVFVYLLLATLALWNYSRKTYVPFLVLYMALFTGLFRLNFPESLIRPTDICIFLNFILIFVSQNKTHERDDNPVSKWVKYILIFYLIEFLITIISGSEYLNYALKVLRIPLFLLGYYAFRVIPLENIMKFIRIACYITVCGGFLFILQYFGIHLLGGYSDGFADKYGDAGFLNNTPALTYICFFYALCNSQMPISSRRFLVVFLSMILIITFVRGVIVSLFISVLFYLVTSKKVKGKILYMVLLLMMIPAALKVVSFKEDKSGSGALNADIGNVISGLKKPLSIDSSEGTFSFRIAMLVERALYLSDNPEYLPLGIGMVHEDSPNCFRRFHFTIGTVNLERYYGQCQIESADITWVPILLRYGFVGIVLHLAIFVILILKTYKRKDLFVFIAPLTLCMFLLTFVGAFFDRIERFYPFMLLLLITSKILNKDRIESRTRQ